MRKQNKILMTRLMMIISQLLLTLFMGYWLYTQFSDHKKLLGKELERGLRSSEEQVIDTMLATTLINPILKKGGKFAAIRIDTSCTDSINIEHNINYGHDPYSKIIMRISEDDKKLIGSYPISSNNETGFSWIDSIPPMDSTRIIIHTERDSSSQLLFQSVKLLINTVGVITTSEDSMSAFLYSNVDTILFQKLFNEYLERKEYGFSTDWLDINDIKEANKLRTGIFIESHLLKSSYGANINNYQIYLLKSISPQIIFALLLLLITASAFRMAYISIKNQRKLITLKNDFISNISHELKTPVSTVKVALEALLDFDMKKDPKLTKEYLEMAHSEMNRLDLLVSKVLNNSALEDGANFIFPKPINLNLLINEVILSMRSRLDEIEAEIILEAGPDTIIVDADQLHLHGVLVNLIDNSLKYSDAKPRISIGLVQNEKEIKITIKDNGNGIPKEYIDKVFDKFFRVPTGDKHNVKGYGLGLNYAALVMQHHQGSISVKNLEDKGCEFTLLFPKNAK